MKQVLLYLWQLPQNFIGFLLTIKFKSIYSVTFNDGTLGNIFFTNTVFGSGVSLGRYIILDYSRHWNFRKSKIMELTYNHEHGHQKQSMYLGPFYLIVIGIPSAIGNILDRIFHNRHSSNCWYYKQPWEKWADFLGGVKRSSL